MKNNRIILPTLFLLIGVTSYSAFKFITITKEKYGLLKELDQIKLQAADLEKEKVSLLEILDRTRQAEKQLIQEKAQLNDQVRVKEEKITKLKTDLVKTHNVIDKLNFQIDSLEEKSEVLQDEKDQLTLKVIQVSQEKDQLNERLNSIPELKKAIREVKIRLRQARLQMRRNLQGGKPGQDAETEVVSGNSGFLIRDGKSTATSNVTIEVIPASGPVR